MQRLLQNFYKKVQIQKRIQTNSFPDNMGSHSEVCAVCDNCSQPVSNVFVPRCSDIFMMCGYAEFKFTDDVLLTYVKFIYLH